MSNETVDTQTLENDDLNTETDLDEISQDSDDTSNDDESKNIEGDDKEDSSEESSVSKEILDELDDEEFIKFFDSGELPSRFDKSKPKEKVPEIKSEQVSDKQTKPITEPNKEQVIDKKKEVAVDYKSTYESIFKPFKANGKDIVPKTAEDVVSLMQMGANYTKKMQAMAPMRKIYESLNNAKINDDELSFLIDLHNGDKEAIKTLLTKHKVDPIDLDVDNTNYVPKNNLVSEEDAEYSSVLDDIQSSLPKIQEIVSTKWDSKSKQMLLKDPNLMRALHEEIELGRFDEIQSRLEIEKTFGRYKDKSDVEAYIDLVTKHVNNTASTTKDNAPINKNHTNTPNKNIPDKSKAAPNKNVKAATQSSQLTPKDIFAMSDEEFTKLSVQNLV